MATKTNCLPPVTIGGIIVTEELLNTLEGLQESSGSFIHLLTEQSMVLAAIDDGRYPIDKKLFELHRDFYFLLRALRQEERSGS